MHAPKEIKQCKARTRPSIQTCQVIRSLIDIEPLRNSGEDSDENSDENSDKNSDRYLDKKSDEIQTKILLR